MDILESKEAFILTTLTHTHVYRKNTFIITNYSINHDTSYSKKLNIALVKQVHSSYKLIQDSTM